MLRVILAKMLFCDLVDLHNVLLHIPVGMANALIPLVLFIGFGMPGAIFGGLLALVFGLGFFVYELDQRAEIKDKCYPDLQGWLWGIILCVVLTAVVYLSLQCLRVKSPPL